MAKRICSICGKEMAEGYVYDDDKYYCSEDCLHHDFTPEEWEQAYDNDEGYWTEWYEESMWKVIAVSCGGVVKHIGYFATEDDAKSFCEDHHWRLWHPEEHDLWTLEVTPPTED